jgi:probable HAF family extracellular repeat protein
VPDESVSLPRPRIWPKGLASFDKEKKKKRGDTNMKSKFRMLLAAITFIAGLALPLRLAAQDKQDHNQHRQAHYTVTDLGPLDGSTHSQAGGLNNRGSVIGFSTLLGDFQGLHAVLWQRGVITDLGTLGGPNSRTNEDPGINDRGVVVGISDTSTPDPNGEDVCNDGSHLICLPFVWQNGAMTALPLLGGNNGFAAAINNRGQIVGMSETPNPDPTCSPFFLQIEAAIWQNGHVQELPPLPGDPDGFANGINDNGQAVGLTGCATGNTHAVLWQNGTAIDLGNLGGATGNIAFDINNRGQVVGQSDIAGDTTHHAFLWQNGVMTDLGTLYGLPVSLANAINSRGQVVGFSQDLNGTNNVPFLWQDGVLTDLNTLISAGSPLLLIQALGINDRGQIAGYALVIATGKTHGFLATPCGEGDEACEGENATGERPKVVLPENVREQLQQRRGFGRFGLGR